MERELDRTVEEVETLGQALAAAELQGDTGFLDRTLAADFVGIGPRGFMLTKEQYLARYVSGDVRFDSFTWDEAGVRAYGEAAVMTGRQSRAGTHQGKYAQAQYRATLVFVKQNGNWRLAGLHLSPIDE